MYDLNAAFTLPMIAWQHALHRIIPVLAFYEFIVVALAIIGAIAIVSRRIGDRFAAWSIVWAIVSLAIFGSVSANRPDAVVAIVLPLAMVGAYAIDWMQGATRWTSIRYVIAAALALTLYVQIATNFVFPVPDPSEAAWRRHALLFWSVPATTVRTVKECERARAAVPPDATAFIDDDAPQAQWYLRDLTQTASPDDANIVVKIDPPENGGVPGNPDVPQFGFEEWWTPEFQIFDDNHAIKYFFTQRAWSDVEIRDLEIKVSKPS